MSRNPTAWTLRLLLAAGLLLSGPAAAGSGGDADPAALARSLLDGKGPAADRAAAAASLSRADPAALGEALLEVARRHDPGDLPFLVDYALGEEARHLRLLAVHSASRSAPGKALDAFLDRAGEEEEEKRSLRAIEAAGFLAGISRDRAGAASRLFALASGPRLLPSLEAIRALGRTIDRAQGKRLVEAVVDASDPHLRKHLCWTLGDLEGEVKAPKLLEKFLKGAGDRPAHAAAALRVFRDGGEPELRWKADALDGLPALWEVRRAGGGRVEVLAAGAEREKIDSFLRELDAAAPAWADLVRLVARQVAVMPMRAETVYEPGTRTLYIAPFEMDSCEKPWQGAYVLARNACVALSVHLGEPDAGHRTWEHACVEIHSFLRTVGHDLGPLEPFVEKTLRKLVPH